MKGFELHSVVSLDGQDGGRKKQTGVATRSAATPLPRWGPNTDYHRFGRLHVRAHQYRCDSSRSDDGIQTAGADEYGREPGNSDRYDQRQRGASIDSGVASSDQPGTREGFQGHLVQQSAVEPGESVLESRRIAAEILPPKVRWPGKS